MTSIGGGMRDNEYMANVLWTIVVVVGSVAVLLVVGVMCYKNLRTPPRQPQPPKPELIEIAIKACVDNKGIPIINSKEVDDETQKYLERCDKPPTQP
jgi:hypothetical protein